ncbi:MAG: HAD family hydrolase [Anaerolineales bacterium]|nr:HAD family hydrolase [Anaerolineales bacterium]
MPLDVPRIRAVLFDLDGTLADTDDEYIERVTRWLRPFKWLFPQGNPRPFLRWGLTTAISPLNTLMMVPDLLHFDEELVRVSNWIADRLDQQAKGHFVLMAGVRPLLEALSARYPLGIITARPERGTHLFLEQFDLFRYFHVVAHAQSAVHTKPFPDPLYWCAERLGVAPEHCLMVGDTAVDILCGRSAGAQTVGVLCGFGSRAELERHGADLILAHTVELKGALDGGSIEN